MNDDKLLAETSELVAREREISVRVILNFIEIEKRSLFAQRGFSSIWEMATKFFGYSEGAAYRRVAASRFLRDLPDAEKLLLSGKLSLTVAAQAQTFVERTKMSKDKVLEHVVGKSSREAERALLELAPETLPRESVRPVTSEHSELRLVIHNALKEKLDQLKGLLSHVDPRMTYVSLVDHLADIGLKKHDPAQRRRRKAPSAPKSDRRDIPKGLKTQVWQRDNGQCTFTDPISGRRCESRHFLEVDHIYPWALGGAHELSNLRLLCRTHNQLCAEAFFGKRSRAEARP